MTTRDFTQDGNFGNDPRRAEQLRLASQIDLDAIDVDVWHGPIGGHGFRSGHWTAIYQGEEYRFFASVPHACELDQQARFLTIDAARHIAGVKSGYIKAND